MMFRSPRRIAGLLVLYGAAIAACSNSTPTPQTFVSATLGPTPGMSQLCSNGIRGMVLVIGTATGMHPTVVQDNGTNMGGIAGVTCQVSGANGGFDVTGVASASAGTLTVIGHIDPSGAGMNVSGTLNVAQTSAAWKQSNCTVTATYGGVAVPEKPPIAGGRVWGHLSCPAAAPDNGQPVLINGMNVTQQCDLEADFLFENCAQ